MCSQADDPSQHVSDDPLRAALLRIFDMAEDRPDIRGVARAALAASATDDTLREAAVAVCRLWFTDNAPDGSQAVRKAMLDLRAALAASATEEPRCDCAPDWLMQDGSHHPDCPLAASATEKHVHTAACHSENCLGRDHD